jgi:ABC-2 type transport system permease protein
MSEERPGRPPTSKERPGHGAASPFAVVDPARRVWAAAKLTLRLARLAGGIFVASLLQSLAHRTNLAVSVALSALGAAGTLGALAAVYAHVERLAGWRFGEALVLLGVYLIVSGLLETFVWPNLQWFGGKVKDGQLDDLLLTPAPVLFTATFGACQPLALTGVALGVAFVVAGVRALGAGAVLITPANILACAALLLAGAVVAWALRLLIAGVALWSPGLELDVFYSSLWQLGRYPVDVYAPWVRRVLTYVVPVAFVSTFPARTLTHGADPQALLAGLFAACSSVVVVSAVWRAGLRRYSSATS